MERQEIREQKRKIRKKALELRSQISEEDRVRASYALADRIIGHQWFYRAKQLLCFVSYGSEIDTSEIMREAFARGKKVFVPKVEGEEMCFYRILSLEELEAGYKGIREPSGCSEAYNYVRGECDQTLMLMPGAAFDSMRRRIGYGKGYYDRFLAAREELQLHTIAIGFRCQLVEEIPEDGRDIRPYQVILQ